MTRLSNYEFLVLALFSASVEVVQAALRDVMAKHFAQHQFGFEERVVDPAEVYVERPPTGGAHLKRAMLFEPANAPGTTAMLSNLEDGWVTMVNVLAERVPGQHLLVRTDVSHDYPMTDFEIWRDGASVRYVGALKEDPSWEFNRRGEPLPFEDTAHYAKRRIRDRLNRELLVNLVGRVGWTLESPDFWRSSKPAFYAYERTQ